MNQKALFAAAVSGILLGGSVAAMAGDPPKDSKDKAGAGAKHACKGKNACKGQGGCKG
jgi:hypothetical protein